MTVALTFHGAAGTVTGSKNLLETPESRVLVDCGLFQGLAELRRRNWAPLPPALAETDAVVADSGRFVAASTTIPLP